MRRIVLCFATIVFGCTGERVGQETVAADATTETIAIPDTAVEAHEASASDVLADADGCAPVAGNVIVNGDFSDGLSRWAGESGCRAELVAGRCGRKAMRVIAATRFGRMRNTHPATFAVGTKVHLRGWFKRSIAEPFSTPPKVFVRSYTPGDGGPPDDYDDEGAVAFITSDWTLAEITFTIKRPQTAFDLFVASALDDDKLDDEFEVADISLVVVK